MIEQEKLISLLPDRLKKLFPQQFRNSYLIHRILASAGKLKIYDELEIPVYLAPPSSGRWITRGGTLPEGQQTEKKMGAETNRYLAMPLSFDMFDKWERSQNPQAIFDFMEQQAMEMAWAKIRNFASAVWSGDGVNQPIGIATAIEKAAPGAQTGVIHSFNKATQAWYRNKYVQITDNFGTIVAGTTLPAGILGIRTIVNQSRTGAYQATDLIGPRAVFENVERFFLEWASPYALISDEKDRYIGFNRFKLFGSWFTWDDNCPTDSLYALRIGGIGQDEGDRVFGDPKNKQKLDWDFEQAADKKIFDTDTSIRIASNPNVKDERIQPRTSLRGLQVSEWLVDSLNLVYPAMHNLVAGGSDNNARWATW